MSLLVICFMYSNVYMSLPTSQIIPSPLLPVVNVSLFSTSVSTKQALFLFCKLVHVCHFLDSTRLTSLSMKISRSVHVAASGIISFFFMADSIPLYICTTSSLSEWLNLTASYIVGLVKELMFCYSFIQFC